MKASSDDGVYWVTSFPYRIAFPSPYKEEFVIAHNGTLRIHLRFKIHNQAFPVVPHEVVQKWGNRGRSMEGHKKTGKDKKGTKKDY